jgi:UDP-3-O-[3-hydroxymyristoyl] N-acetylglucosamine deacetylase
LRYHDEFVRHKALDCIGDLYLSGYRIDARFTFMRPGHSINNKLLHAIFADESSYEIVPSGRTQESSLSFVAASVPAYV